jgi:hypothetical protein
VYTPLPATDDATLIKHKIDFLKRQLQLAQKELEQISGKEATQQPAQEPDPPKNGAKSSRTV